MQKDDSAFRWRWARQVPRIHHFRCLPHPLSGWLNPPDLSRQPARIPNDLVRCVEKPNEPGITYRVSIGDDDTAVPRIRRGSSRRWRTTRPPRP